MQQCNSWVYKRVSDTFRQFCVIIKICLNTEFFPRCHLKKKPSNYMIKVR